jgi:uncharacterized protein (DUF4415 family)
MKHAASSQASQTDRAQLQAMRDEEIDLSDIPEVTPEMFARAVVLRELAPRRKAQLTLRIDADVLDWFKSQGRGYQTKINTLLRAYMEEVKTQTVLHEAKSDYKSNP